MTENGAVQQFVGDLLQKGIVDVNFEQLVSLQDESNPRFAAEVVEMFLEKSKGIGPEVENNLTAGNFAGVVEVVHQFKGSSATVGAHAVAGVCSTLCQAAKEENMRECSSLLEKLRAEVTDFNSHMEAFLKV
ncbi:hypothetical protein BSKO_08891 [Bryopsis sp. KO-2023]|nr:hypothetical protein BSKO_08891 [Bryopsis sp. KO-2023]